MVVYILLLLSNWVGPWYGLELYCWAIMKKGTSKFVARSKKNWANWADCYMGQMRIAMSFATSLALSAATSHVIIHVVLFGSICYDEFVSAFINDRENDVLWWSQKLVSDPPSVMTATSLLQVGSDRKQTLIVTEAQDSCSGWCLKVVIVSSNRT